MIRPATLIASLAINIVVLPALASQCVSQNEIGASQTRWAAMRRQFINTADRETACRVFAAGFVESVVTRQAATTCAVRGSDIDALDSEINTFNDLLATRCHG
jgi:hypothetical protein